MSINDATELHNIPMMTHQPPFYKIFLYMENTFNPLCCLNFAVYNMYVVIVSNGTMGITCSLVLWTQ